MTIAIITGTRPEVIKLYPIMRLFDLKGIDYKFVHTGQHYDHNMSTRFFEQFKIRSPDYNIGLTSSAPLEQISQILSNLYHILQSLEPRLVLIQGDTNSVLSSALSAIKCGIQVAHVESGLRNAHWKTPEEHNRRLVDSVSDLLFAPTEESKINLEKENIKGDIYVVGNTVIDAVKLCFESGFVKRQSFEGSEEFVLVTLHRAENVDNECTLRQVLMALSNLEKKIIFPIHPRTRKNIQRFGLEHLLGSNILCLEPVGYFEFLELLRRSRYIITDSGGIEEEVTSPYLDKQALVLRDSTERPESIRSGHAILCKPYVCQELTSSIRKLESQTGPVKSHCPYGYGDSAEKIVEILLKRDECL